MTEKTKVTVGDVAAALDALAPFDTQMEWDNCGLLVGDPRREVAKILVALDATNEVIRRAAGEGAQAVVAHHPVIFHPAKRFLAGDPAYEAAAAGVAVLAAHTCYDMAPRGINFALASALGLRDARPLWQEGARSLGLAGELPRPMAPEELAAWVEKALGLPAGFVRYRLSLGEGREGEPLRRAAVCGGAGGDYLEEAAALGCDCYITGDVRHHEFLEARRRGILLMDAGHHATENIAMAQLRGQLEEALPGVEVLLF